MNRLLRQAYERVHELPPGELDRSYHIAHLQAELHADYRSWLRANGVDPETGPVTRVGVAFLEECLRAVPYRWTVP